MPGLELEGSLADGLFGSDRVGYCDGIGLPPTSLDWNC